VFTSYHESVPVSDCSSLATPQVITGCCTSKEAIAELMQLAATAPSMMLFSKKISLQNPFKAGNQAAILKTAGVAA
jgi:hypothetical protein